MNVDMDMDMDKEDPTRYETAIEPEMLTTDDPPHPEEMHSSNGDVDDGQGHECGWSTGGEGDVMVMEESRRSEGTFVELEDLADVCVEVGCSGGGDELKGRSNDDQGGEEVIKGRESDEPSEEGQVDERAASITLNSPSSPSLSTTTTTITTNTRKPDIYIHLLPTLSINSPPSNPHLDDDNNAPSSSFELESLVWPDTANEVISRLAGKFPWPCGEEEEERLIDQRVSSHHSETETSGSESESSISSTTSTDTTNHPSDDTLARVLFTFTNRRQSSSFKRVPTTPRSKSTKKRDRARSSPGPEREITVQVSHGLETRSLERKRSGEEESPSSSSSSSSLAFPFSRLGETFQNGLQGETDTSSDRIVPREEDVVSTIPDQSPTIVPTSPLSSPTTRSPRQFRTSQGISMVSPPTSTYASEPLPPLPLPPPRDENGKQSIDEDRVGQRVVSKDSTGTFGKMERLELRQSTNAIDGKGVKRRSSVTTSHNSSRSSATSATAASSALTYSASVTSSINSSPPASVLPLPPLSNHHLSQNAIHRSFMMPPPTSPDSSGGSVSSFGEVINVAGNGIGYKYQSPRMGGTVFDTIDEERGGLEVDMQQEGVKGSDGEFPWGTQRDLKRSNSGGIATITNSRIVGPSDRFHHPPSSFVPPSAPQLEGAATARSNGESTVRRQRSASDLNEQINGRGQRISLSSSVQSSGNGYQRRDTLPISAVSASPSINQRLGRTPSQSTVNSSQYNFHDGPHKSSVATEIPRIERDSSGHPQAAGGPHPHSHRSHAENRSHSSTISQGSHPFSSRARRPSITSDSSDTQHPFAMSSYTKRVTPTLPHSTPVITTLALQQPQHQVSLVNEEDMVNADDETCPICVESLSSSFRLAGERSHITPVCGHSLHHECFVTVYGPVPESAVLLRRANFGMCGVCRKPMQLENEDEFGGTVGKAKQSSKFAAMTGMDTSPGIVGANIRFATSKYNGGLPQSSSTTSFGSSFSTQPSDPNTDDQIDLPTSAGGSARSIPQPPSVDPLSKVVIPAISIKPEYTSIARNISRHGKQMLTCIVTVEVPSAGQRPQYQAPSISPSPNSTASRSPSTLNGTKVGRMNPGSLHSTQSLLSQGTSTSGPDPFAHVASDLRNRLLDYRESGLGSLGPIRLYDILRVRKGSYILQIYVYLFQQAIICVSDEKKKGLRGFLSSSSSSHSLRDSDKNKKEKGTLKLTGRIYLHHVKRIVDSSIQGELSLTIAMQDEALDSFILTFTDRSSHETWRSTLTYLLEEANGKSFEQHKSPLPNGPPPPSGQGGKLARMGIDESVLACVGQSRGASPPQKTTIGFGSTLDSVRDPEREALVLDTGVKTSFGPAPLAPAHTPVDLVVVASLPSLQNSSAAATKLRIIQSTLEFTLALLGPYDRVSLVTFEPGQGGAIRRTGFFCAGKQEGRRKLDAFLARIDGREDVADEDDPYVVVMPSDEKIDVVAGVNVGLDAIMQRRVRNPLTGMLLVSDTVDTIKRGQMDLLLARAEAASVPIHSFGYGKTQDPSALWLMSSHTHGTYTFVKEWYDLRDCVAGVIGGMLSIAITNMKIHLSCQESKFKCRKVSGEHQNVVSTDGKDIDIELRELRHGQKVEFLVEMEWERDVHSHRNEGSSEDGDDSPPSSHARSSGRSFSKAGSFNGDGDLNTPEGLTQLYDGGLVDEVPVFDLDCAYHDPAIGRSVARLSHPILLTVAVLPTNTSSSATADLAVVRRRYELLASESITRCLLLVARKNWAQAQRLMQETTRILTTVIHQLSAGISGQAGMSANRARKDLLTRVTIESLQAALGDVDALQEGMEEHREMFERDHRNYGAQQAMVLRNQKSWSLRTPTEQLYCAEGSREVITMSLEWKR